MNYDTITGLPHMESFFSFTNAYIKRENFNRFAFLALYIQTDSSGNSHQSSSSQYALLSLIHKFVRKHAYILSAYRYDKQTLVCLLDTSLLAGHSLEESLVHAKKTFMADLKNTRPYSVFMLKGGICYHKDTDSISLSIAHALSALQLILDQKIHADFFTYKQESKDTLSVENDIISLFDYSYSNKKHTLLYLQPRFRCDSMFPSSSQALVRIIDNSGKLFNPSSFLPVLEKNGLLPDLDLTVTERILQLITHWQEKHITPFPVSIHLSDTSLKDDSFFTFMDAFIEKYRTAFSYLLFEISFSVFQMEKQRVLTFAHFLHQASAKIYIELSELPDDYSVKDFFAFDGITCNRTFLLHTLYAENNHSITRDFIESFDNCNLSSICKSIETNEEADFARFCHFSDLQGFLYGRPLPIDIFQKKYMNFVFASFEKNLY